MKLLRLGNSDDIDPSVPDDQKNWYVAGKVLEEAIGEPVETVVKAIWPGEELPRKVSEWIDEYRPDMVFLKVTWVWYGYESVPRRIERIFGRVGKPVARAGVEGGEASEARTHMVVQDRTPRRPPRHRWGHAVALGCRPGNHGGHYPEGCGARERGVTGEGYRRRAPQRGPAEGTVRTLREAPGLRRRERRDALQRTSRPLCRHRPPEAGGAAGPGEGDRIHPGATGHYWMGRQEGLALIDAWKASGGSVRAD
ncbi:hypothetical protein [Candidatus Amarobacter glycogenicus]|uniref:hypothetical protein n=1 Tax=Candidatus Amarobacter glycogenicus TaxID=3140699 RepID=UPI002A13DB7A|nr:hypothetical protein [Dehalococcoidia bacterium]